MNMVTVYRVEGDKGLGPYLGDYEKIINPYAHGPFNGRPGWDLEVDDFTNNNEIVYKHCKAYYHAGFLCIKQLYSWFGGYIPKFYKHTDLRIKRFIVPEDHIMTTKSGKQILFIKPGTDLPDDSQITDVEFEIDEIPF